MASAPLGVVVAPPKLDLAAMMKHKDATVAANVNGVAYPVQEEQDRLGQRRGTDRRAGQGDRQRRRRQGDDA